MKNIRIHLVFADDEVFEFDTFDSALQYLELIHENKPPQENCDLYGISILSNLVMSGLPAHEQVILIRQFERCISFDKIGV
jgi:hypothetical protein|tara:strand:+ start:783 stop:1025 length:243 start_codon:yes stop_codon:yes gene_type:complete